MTTTHSANKSAWWELTLEVPASWAEDASASLIEAGALGVQAVDAVTEPLAAFAKATVQPRQHLPSRPGHALLIASYVDAADAAPLIAEAVGAIGELGVEVPADSVRASRRDDHDWAEGWKQYFKPLKIGRRLWIVPTWETTFEPPRGSLVLLCDPGMAFGTGQHATTSLCLKAIELFADTWVPADKARAQVLDFGCGTGILGIAAAKLGFGRVVGIDNDPLAVQATDDNIRLNGVADRMAASDAAVGDVGETFDLVVANILAVTLNELADLVLRRVKPGGTLVLSGILATQADEVIRTYERAAGRAALPFRFEGRWTHGEWVALRFHAS